MQLPVLIEPICDRPGYVARLGDPFHLSTEAETPDKALQELTALVQRRLQAGARVALVSIPAAASAPAAGWLPDDELTQEWLEAIRAYRTECDEADRRRILGEGGPAGTP